MNPSSRSDSTSSGSGVPQALTSLTKDSSSASAAPTTPGSTPRGSEVKRTAVTITNGPTSIRQFTTPSNSSPTVSGSDRAGKYNRYLKFRILVCDGCGDKFLRPPTMIKGTFDFCDQDCLRLARWEYANVRHARTRKRLRRERRSARKTVREDLAWFYKQLDEDNAPPIRGYGGAHWRNVKARKKVISQQ